MAILLLIMARIRKLGLGVLLAVAAGLFVDASPYAGTLLAAG